jgi:CheY-like chemotaxis protein
MELAEWELRKEGIRFASIRVETMHEFISALEEFHPDIIISDYALPEFNGMQALRITKEKNPGIPFIVLTGSTNEITAVECMKAGATDYVIKGHTTRLPFALCEALVQAKVNREKEEAEAGLRKSEMQLKSIIEATADGILAVDNQGKVIRVNSRFIRMWRIPQELIDLGDDNKLLEFVLDQLDNPEAFLAKVRELYVSGKEDKSFILFKDGRVFQRFSSPLILNDSIVGRVWSFTDITDQRKSEQEIRKKVKELEDFYQMAVGRELRMVALKEEIENLKKELEHVKKGNA